MEEGERLSWGDWGNISGGKPVEVVRINLARAATRWLEVQMGESASSEMSPGRCNSFWREHDLQWRTACSKVAGEARHLGQREGRSQLNQDGWAAR